MNSEDIGAAVRAAVQALGGGLIAGGYMTQDQLTQIGGAAAIIFGLIWSLYQKKKVRDAKVTG